MVFCQLLILAVFLGLWEYATAWNKQAAFLFGSPSAIGGFLVKMWQDGSLVRDTWVTGLETILGFLAGNILGGHRPVLVVLALRLARGPALHRGPGLDPDHRPAPIVIIWFGTGRLKIAMSTLSVVIVALVTSYKGAMSVDPDQINLMRTLGASKRTSSRSWWYRPR